MLNGWITNDAWTHLVRWFSTTYKIMDRDKCRFGCNGAYPTSSSFLYFGLSASAFAVMQSPDCKNKQTNGTTSVSKVLVKKQTMSGFRCWSLWYIWELLGLLQIKRFWVCVTAVTRLYFWVASRCGPFRQLNNHRR